MREHSYDIRIQQGRRTLVSVEGFSIARDRITFLFGESGIGKSLVSRALYGLLDPAEFDITVNRRPYADYCADPDTIAMQRDGFFVFQEPSSHLHPMLTLLEQLREGALSHVRSPEPVLKQLWENADDESLRRLTAVYPTSYRPSGGEKQRVLLAMALMKMDIRLGSRGPSDDALFVFDEPTGSLDNRHRDLFLSLVAERYMRRPVTILFVTHDYTIVKRVADAHPELVQRADFKELALESGRLALRDFAPSAFTTWLGGLGQSRAERDSRARVQLEVESGIELFDRRLSFYRDSVSASPVSLEVRSGELNYLKAPSGEGKTSVAKAVMGLLPARILRARADSVVLSGSTPRAVWREEIWGKRMTMVFQHADEALNQQSTVRDTFTGLPVSRRLKGGDIEKILGLLFDAKEIPRLLLKKVWMLSGGQKQRVNLLRALALEPRVMILDEPLNGLDFESVKRVVSLLRQKQEEGTGLLLISHNEEVFDALTGGPGTYHLRAQIIGHQPRPSAVAAAPGR